MERSGVALIANESEAVVFEERECSPARLNRLSRSGGLDFLFLFDQAKRKSNSFKLGKIKLKREDIAVKHIRSATNIGQRITNRETLEFQSKPHIGLNGEAFIIIKIPDSGKVAQFIS